MSTSYKAHYHFLPGDTVYFCMSLWRTRFEFCRDLFLKRCLEVLEPEFCRINYNDFFDDDTAKGFIDRAREVANAHRNLYFTRARMTQLYSLMNRTPTN